MVSTKSKAEVPNVLNLNEIWLWEKPEHILLLNSVEQPLGQSTAEELMAIDWRMNGAFSKWKAEALGKTSDWTYLPVFRDTRVRHLFIFTVTGKAGRVESAEIDKLRQTLLRLKVNEIALVCPTLEQAGRELRKTLKGVTVFETRP